jgi:hypothetical protein
MSLIMPDGSRTVPLPTQPNFGVGNTTYRRWPEDSIRELLGGRDADAERGIQATLAAHDKAASQKRRDRDAAMQHGGMDPIAWMEHSRRRDEMQRHVTQLMNSNPGMTQESAARIATEGMKIGNKPFNAGSREDKLFTALYPQARAGTRLGRGRYAGSQRDMDRTTPALANYRPAGGPVTSHIMNEYGRPVAPNPAFGAMHGLEWDGDRWVPKNPNQDLERQMMELELDRRRKDMDDSGAGDHLRSWLAKRLGG